MCRKTFRDTFAKGRVLFSPYKSLAKDAPDKFQGFLDLCARRNRIAAIAIVSMGLAMESLMVVLYLLQPYVASETAFFPGYIYLYSSMLAVCPCFLLLLMKFQHSPRALLLVEQAIMIWVCIWSAVFSALDVKNGFSSYLFIQMVIINSLVFTVRPVLHCAISLTGYAVYVVLVLFSGLDLTTTFAELVNPFFMVVAACVMAVINYRRRIGTYIDTELIKEQNSKLEYYANNDFLTKILNRKGIIDYLDEIASANGKAITCIIIDIDNFKLYNDTYGHIMGDRCLVMIAAALEHCVLRHDGKVGRYGGEEFLALFTDKEQDGVSAIANELMDAVRALGIAFPESAVGSIATISVGVYTHKADADGQDAVRFSKDTVLTRADTALYQAKGEGKNRACIYEEEAASLT